MGKSIEVAVLEGDGVGPEIVGVTCDVVSAAAAGRGVPLTLRRGIVGWKAYRESGTTMPDETVSLLESCAGWIVGPTSAGDYPADDPVKGHPSGFMRRHFELFANIRPVDAWSQLPAIVPVIHTTVIRENTEGFYPDRNLFWGYGEFMPTRDVGISLRVITREACLRLARLTYDYAISKDLSEVVVVHKRTALPHTDGLFIEAFEEIGQEYPGIEAQYMRIDTFSSTIMIEPERFPLVATTNLFGDIISDQVSGLAGGVGLAPSLNAGHEHAMAQAVHGTAEDIAGKGMANPVALVLSGGLLLEWLGRRDGNPAVTSAGADIRNAVDAVLQKGMRTRDVGGTASTSDVGEALLAYIGDVGDRDR